MRIGLLTIQKPPENYGASLQCYALWKYIRSLGYDCEVIDLYRPWHPEYVPGSRDPQVKKSASQRFKSFLRRLTGRSKRQNKARLTGPRRKAFETFNALPDYSNPYKSVDELYRNPPLYDVYMAGSDQIWNPAMPIVNEAYFLTFAPEGAPRISYASSFAVDELDAKTSDKYACWLSRFSSISVRERTGVGIVDRMKGVSKAVQVLDPVFLLPRAEWDAMAEAPGLTEEYLFVYTLQLQAPIIAYVRKLTRILNLKAVLIVSSTGESVDDPDIIQIDDAGPSQWLGWIRDARMVVTDSFHCTVFSMLFGKPFLTVCSKPVVSSRITDLLSMFSLENHFVSAVRLGESSLSDSEATGFDYERFLSRLETERARSCDFLNAALNVKS